MVTASDRRRFVIASVVTALAIPLLVRDLASDDKSEAPVGAASPVAGVQVAGVNLSATSTASGTAAPATPSHQAEGKIGFRFYEPAQWGDRPCASAGLAPNTRVVIANLNNGKTTWCVVVKDARGVVRDHLLEVADTVFAEIADPSVGVIPARIAW